MGQAMTYDPYHVSWEPIDGWSRVRCECLQEFWSMDEWRRHVDTVCSVANRKRKELREERRVRTLEKLAKEVMKS